MPDRNSAIAQRGAVLLEVVLALVLFVAAATIISAGLNASLNSVERLRLTTHAANLAVSVVSELQMGIKTMDLAGAQPFAAPFEGWSWEVLGVGDNQSPPELNGGAGFQPASRTTVLKTVEVVIRHDDPELVYRLSQTLQMEGSDSTKEATASLERHWVNPRGQLAGLPKTGGVK
jgi:hypothetical protein